MLCRFLRQAVLLLLVALFCLLGFASAMGGIYAVHVGSMLSAGLGVLSVAFYLAAAYLDSML